MISVGLSFWGLKILAVVFSIAPLVFLWLIFKYLQKIVSSLHAIQNLLSEIKDLDKSMESD